MIDSLWLPYRRRSWRDCLTSSPRLSWEVSKSWRWCCSECMTVASNMNSNTSVLCSYLTAATPTFISIACCVIVIVWLLSIWLEMYVFTCCLFHREFGVKVMNMKLLMKALPTMFENSDKNVRAEVHVGTYLTCSPSYSHVNSLWIYTGIHIGCVG